MTTAGAVRQQLRALGDPGAAQFAQRFFRTGPGEYGEGDVFLGIRVDESFGGTWGLIEDDGLFFVELDHEADTFLDDVALFVDTPDRLTVEFIANSGELVQLALIRRE